MTLTLRPYQTEIIEKAIAAWKSGHRRVMMQLPTAAGKTIILSDIARTVVIDGGRVLLMSHRTELVEQGAARLELMTGLECGIIQGGRRARPSLNLQSASVQSLGPRLSSIGDFDLVIVDEAHHGSSKTKTYGNVLRHFSQSAHLGVTATPVRTDGSGFADMFDVMVTGPSVKQLIAEGHLSKYRLFADESVMHTDGVKQQGGDYNQKQLAEANDSVELSGSLVESYSKHCPGKQCLIFTINVEHSIAVSEAYQRAGVKAMHLDGTTPKEIRADAIAAFKNKEIQVVTNVGLFTEGTDIPGIDAVQIARPTKSLALHLQMLGRALRTAPGKAEALLIDHTDNYARLGLPCRDRLWSLEGVEGDAVETVVNASGEVEEQLVLVSKFAARELDVELTHITEDPLDGWASTLMSLIDEQVETDKPAGWVAFKLTELDAPLAVWEEYARYAGHKPSWAKLMSKARLKKILDGKSKPLPRKGTAKPEAIEQLALMSDVTRMSPAADIFARSGMLEAVDAIRAGSYSNNHPEVVKVAEWVDENQALLEKVWRMKFNGERSNLSVFNSLARKLGYQPQVDKILRKDDGGREKVYVLSDFCNPDRGHMLKSLSEKFTAKPEAIEQLVLMG